ncbi:MAG: DHH family phosphoesterase [Solobacterium sp.]|nr:DHH family phosphoesterase [Solobacterium sp.]
MASHNNAAAAIVIAVIAASLSAPAGFILGKNQTQRAWEAQRAAEIERNRSELQNLTIQKGPIYVIGHLSPDSDTVCSAIAYAELLNKLGYDARPAIAGPLNRETEFILEHAGVPVPEILDQAGGENIVLVDHSDYAQSVDGMKEANIISIIDHHGAAGIINHNPFLYTAKPVAAAASAVWDCYNRYGVEIDEKTAEVLLGAILSDSRNLSYSTVTELDRQAADALQKRAGIIERTEYYEKLRRAALSRDGMSDMEILLADSRKYETESYRYAISCVTAIDEADAKAVAEQLKDDLSEAEKLQEVDLMYLVISYFPGKTGINFTIPSSELAKEIYITAFPDDPFDGTMFIKDPSMSRKAGFVPAISGVLNSYPHE